MTIARPPAAPVDTGEHHLHSGSETVRCPGVLFRIRCDTNDYEGEVSADAAGIIGTLFAFSHLSFRDRSDRMANAYARLYAFAADHPEAQAIFRAID